MIENWCRCREGVSFKMMVSSEVLGFWDKKYFFEYFIKGIVYNICMFWMKVDSFVFLRVLIFFINIWGKYLVLR